MATKKRKKMGSGWVKIDTPQDLRAAIQRMINKILMSRTPLDHVGAFATLANAWTNSFRMEIELIEVKELERRLSELEDLKRYQGAKERESLGELEAARRELRELLKQCR